MIGEIGRWRRALVISGDAEPGDLMGITETAIGDDAGHAPDLEPVDEDRAGGSGARVLAAVEDHDRARRTLLDRDALRMATVQKYGERIEILARRNVAQ